MIWAGRMRIPKAAPSSLSRVAGVNHGTLALSPRAKDAASAPAKGGQAAAEPIVPARRRPWAIGVFLGIAVLGIAADLSTKHLVFKSLLSDSSIPARLDRLSDLHNLQKPEDLLRALRLEREVFPGVSFTLSTNPGVVFGLPMPRWLVALVSVSSVVVVTVFFGASPAKARAVHVGLAMILAGAVGNLYDRLFGAVALPSVEPICYQVRDFIDCSRLYYPYIFNVADILLVVGVGFLAIHCLWGARGGAEA